MGADARAVMLALDNNLNGIGPTKKLHLGGRIDIQITISDVDLDFCAYVEGLETVRDRSMKRTRIILNMAPLHLNSIDSVKWQPITSPKYDMAAKAQAN